MSKILTEKDFEAAAKKLRCEIAAIKAVAEIESLGSGFYKDGFPVILFERHVFRKYTKGQYNRSHPHLSGPAGNYGAAGQNQRNKFNEAFVLDAEAAMKSCSWGKFQLMGFNHEVCGFATIHDFVNAMKVSEGEHLLGFVNFVINNNLADELRNKDWAKFAKGYNGAGYAKNKYDVKMAAAYRKFVRQKPIPQQIVKTEPQPIAPTDSAVVTTEIETANETATVTETTNEQDVNFPAEVSEPKPQGIFGKLSAGISTLFGGTAIYTAVEKFGGVSISQTVLILIVVAVILAFLGFLFWAWLDAWKASQRVKLETEAKTAIDKKDVKWVKQ